MDSGCDRCTSMFVVLCISTCLGSVLIGLELLRIQKRKKIRSTAIKGPFKFVYKTVPYFPIEIISEILPYLEVKDLLRFKTVCKQWNTLIHEALTQDPYFPQKFTLCKTKTFTCHLIPYGSKERNAKSEWFLGTCNGLDFTMERMKSTIGGILSVVFDAWTFHIRNTETRQVLRVPCQAYYKMKSCHYAFAFIPNTNEYKLANIYFINDTQRACDVLTLGGSGADELKWRYIVFPNSKKEITLVQDSWVVQAGAVVHCMNYITLQPGLHFAYEIMSIDLESEEITETQVRLDFFSKSPLPPEYAISWNGCLAFASTDRPTILDVWVLEDYKKNNWSDRFSVSLSFLKEYNSDDFVPLLAQDGLLWLRSIKAGKVIGYDMTRKRKAQMFVIPKEVCYTVKVSCKVPSLARLKGMKAAYPY